MNQNGLLKACKALGTSGNLIGTFENKKKIGNMECQEQVWTSNKFRNQVA